MTQENKEEVKLPSVEYPKMEMPESPKIDLPKDAPHVSCDGEMPQIPVVANLPPPPEGMSRIIIGVPILSYSHDFVMSFLKLWTECITGFGGKFQIGYHFVYRRPVHMAEQEIIDVAIANKATHVLFMDDDIYDVSAKQLNMLLEADKDVISGVMYASKFPYAMCVFRRYNTERKVIDMPVDNSMYRLYEVPCKCPKCGFALSHWDAKFCLICGEPQNNLLQKVDLIPFCFTLMKLSIFDRIKRPWFHCTDKYPTDSWFSDRCIEAGIQEWAHMGVRLNHNGVNDITRPFLMNMGLEKAKSENKGVVTLTPDDMTRHELMLNNKLKEAEAKLQPAPEFIQVG